MSTGYTYSVQAGTVTDFKEFALNCARAFGALITMCDMPSDAPIPDAFQPSMYHAEVLEKAHATKAVLLGMTASECEVAATKEYYERKSAIAKADDKRFAEFQRYQNMLKQAKEWTPPTPDHDELKKFMIEQLEDSIKFDCHKYDMPEPILLSGKEWLAKEIARIEKDIQYHQQENKKEIDRVSARNKWVKDLRESL